MKALSTLVCALVVLPVAPAFGDLAEPGPNAGATEVAVEGTRVRAEAWAVALGHEVESIVVARLRPQPGPDGKPVVDTYERWSLDGRKKLERGDRSLGKSWEKTLWSIVEEAERQRGKRRGPRRDLLERLGEGLGRAGSRIVGEWVVGWSVGTGRMESGGRTSIARTAVVTFRPAGPGRTTTPSEEGDASPRGPVTPGEGAIEPERPRRTPGGFGAGAARGAGRGVVDTEKGVREHAVVEVDLGAPGRIPRPPAATEVTPGE